MGKQVLSIGTKLGYGVCDFGGNLFFTATAFVLMNYLTDTVCLSAALAGTALMVGRLWDAFYDPVIGFISDRTTTRMGRRRPFMLGGAIPLFFAMILMFTNPSLLIGAGVSQATLFLYAVVVYIILCTAYSTVNIPYLSMAPELTPDYNERSSLMGYRSAFSVFGTLLGAGAALPIVAMAPDKSMGFVLMGTVFGAVLLVSALVTVFSVKEPAGTRPPNTMGFVATYTQVFKNKPYGLILLTYILQILALTIMSAIAIYYFKYVLLAEAMTTAAMLILIVTAMLFIPASVLMSKRFGKKISYATGFAIMAISLIIIFLFGNTFGVTFNLVMMFFLGAGMGFTYAMPFSINADAIEYDYLCTGERREGAFLGVWTWGVKIGQALSIFFMGLVLDLMGYVANLIPQAPSALLGIRLFLGPISAGILVIAIIVLSRYPITEQKYEEICEQIKEMEEKRSAALQASGV